MPVYEFVIGDIVDTTVDKFQWNKTWNLVTKDQPFKTEHGKFLIAIKSAWESINGDDLSLTFFSNCSKKRIQSNAKKLKEKIKSTIWMKKWRYKKGKEDSNWKESLS